MTASSQRKSGRKVTFILLPALLVMAVGRGWHLQMAARTLPKGVNLLGSFRAYMLLDLFLVY
ncbi:MAG: hypothetical protein ABSB41_11400 [Anaerolineales bacterium]